VSQAVGNLISGGQIFIHRIAMFKQIAGKAVSVSFILSLALSSLFIQDKFNSISWHPALTYWWGVLMYETDKAVDLLFPGGQIGKIDISTDRRQIREVRLDHFVKDRYYITHGEELKSLIITFGIYNLIGITGFLIIIFIGWGRIGKSTKETLQLSGSTIKTAREIASILQNKKKASDIIIAGMPLVKDSETKGTLITGANGSGKTNYLHEILPQIRKRKQPAMVIDLEGGMVARYYRPGYDIIINPFDKRTHCWDFRKEVIEKEDLEAIAHSLFGGKSKDSSEVSKLFADWATDLFICSIRYLKNHSELTTRNLYEMIHLDTSSTLMKKLKGTSAAIIMDLNNEKNVTAHNIRSTAMAYTKWLELVDENVEPDKKICFKDYFSNLDKESDRWIFLTANTKHAKVLLPLISLLLDVAVMSLMERGEDLKRRYWFVMDELAALNRLPVLELYITRLRKYGGCLLAATQSFKQFYTKYGRDAGNIMLSQFNTNIVCRINDPEEAAMIIKQVGNIEYSKKQKNISFGAHEHRDGESYTEQERSKPLIDINDFKLLNPLEAYVLLPEAEVAIGKIKSEIQAPPKNIQQFFIPKPNKEEISPTPKTTNKPSGKKEKNQKQLNKK
jgi:type IV conjugative transfer system coupling protein TraD